MSRVDELISGRRPGGVHFVSLGDVGTIFGGLSGKSKADFSDGNARFVSYVNVFSNIAVDTSRDDFVAVAPSERQRELLKGDILFTGSSETADEVATSSVITVGVSEPLYLNSFCIGYRFHDQGAFDPEFTKHLFRSGAVRKQLIKTASGVTRFNVSKARLANVKIPAPPLAIQREIASVLDEMGSLRTELEFELESELALRSCQYAHYRDRLLSSDWGDVPRPPMGELGQFARGRRFTKRDVVPGGIAAIHYGEIYTHYGVATSSTISHVREDMRGRLRFARPGEVVFAAVGETVEDVAKAVAWLGDEPVAIHDDTFSFRSDLNPKFVSYFAQTAEFHQQKNKYVARAKVKRLSGDSLAKIRIPVPSAEEQQRVVDILDKFDALASNLSIGLPAEVMARRRQYEYHRDRLMSFGEGEV